MAAAFYHRNEAGEVVFEIFEDEVCPEGWFDSPVKVPEAAPKAKGKPKAEAGE